MPVYEYRCTNGHTFEVVQRMSDEPVAACQVCGSAVERVFHPVAVHFKGSGFYATDYGKKKAAAGADSTPKKDSEGTKETPAKAESASTASDKSSSGSGSTSSSSD